MEGKKTVILLHMPQEQRISVPEAPAGIEPTHSTCAAEDISSNDIEPTHSTCAAHTGAPGDTEPIPSTCAPDSSTPADAEQIPSPCPADSGVPANTEPIPSPCPTGSAESNEKHDSETSSDKGLDFIIDLAVYKEHARDTPHADPEPTPGPCNCYSLDPIERSDLNVSTLLLEEDKNASLSSEEESALVPDLDENLAPTQDAEGFF